MCKLYAKIYFGDFMFKNEWKNVLSDEIKKEYYTKLITFIDNEYKVDTIYPLYDNIYKSLDLTDYNDVRVVILGQDPYHGIGEAHGLSFSVEQGISMPPSLRNIFKELKSDLNIDRQNTDLTDWANQGVLLLNSILTVKKDTPLSHKNKGWEKFTDKIIEILGERDEPIVFILWGNYARSKKDLIKNKKHLIIESAHPSPLSAPRGFFGSKPFSKTNVFLEKCGYKKIEW